MYISHRPNPLWPNWPLRSINLVFVVPNFEFWNFAITHKGAWVVRQLQQHYRGQVQAVGIPCEDLSLQFDRKLKSLTVTTNAITVFFHIRSFCPAALEEPFRARFAHHKVRHVFDVIDSPDMKDSYELPLDGLIVNSEKDKQECEAVKNSIETGFMCQAIPHSFNLPCGESKAGLLTEQGTEGFDFQPNRKLKLIIFNWASVLPLAIIKMIKTLEEKGWEIVRESNLNVDCSRYADASAGLAWRKTSQLGPRWRHSPSERFTNGVMMNIPTIGHAGMHSFKDFDGASEFLCWDAQCVLRKLDRLKKNPSSFSQAWKQLRRSVREKVGTETLLRQYASFAAE